jgi:hypothetical protein
MTYRLPHPEAKPPTLDPANVPQPFRHLIPLAEKYGVSDDGYRIDLIDSLNTEELEECAAFLDFYDLVLENWLAGPEADGPTFSTEYISFSALGMAADQANARLDRRAKP